MPASTHTLPCVVQLGFAGSRRLFDSPPADPQQLDALHAVVEQHLTERLARLGEELKVDANHFLVGISQIACGGDTLFARACRSRKIPHRIFLPQHRQAYLSAVDSEGTADFKPSERIEAEELLESAQIIQERVVSHSPDRTARFMETNVEILRVSDVIVCLLRDRPQNKPGGTSHLLERAKGRGTPVLEIRVGMTNGRPTFQEQWHHFDARHPHPFKTPQLPKELADLPLATAEMPPSQDSFCRPLKGLVSTQADLHQRLFKFAAVLIILTHTLATICATLAVALHHHEERHASLQGDHRDEVAEAKPDQPLQEQPEKWPYITLLAVEVVLLVGGFLVHRHLHHSRAARIWAVSRVVAELARSLEAIGDRHIYLEYLFRLPLPFHFRPLLRTLNIVHLRSTWPHRNDDWKSHRDRYIAHRFDHETNGQIPFYEQRLEEDKFRLKLCQRAFTIFSMLALTATVTKLSLLTFAPPHWDWKEPVMTTLGALAIVLPVLAVGGLSWAAALDCEARVETFGETLDFLRRQKPFLEQAESASEFDLLLMETETALLGEIANWFSRRSTIGVN